MGCVMKFMCYNVPSFFLEEEFHLEQRVHCSCLAVFALGLKVLVFVEANPALFHPCAPPAGMGVGGMLSYAS